MKQLFAKRMDRALRDYVEASRAYNLDCNLRLGVKTNDAKRWRLLKVNDRAFGKLLATIQGLNNK